KAIEDKNIEYIFNPGVYDLALFYRTYYNDEVLKTVITNLVDLLEKTNESLLHLSLINLATEIIFIQLTENEEYYKEKLKIVIVELISKISKIKSNVNKDYPQEIKLATAINTSLNFYLAGNFKNMEAVLLETQKNFPENPRVNMLLALSKTKTSSTVYKMSLIEVIKTSGNNLEKAIAQEMVGDISEVLQSISWYEDSENIYLSLGLYRDLVRLYQKKIQKLKTDNTKKLQLAQEYIKLATTLLKLKEKDSAKKYFFEAFNILLQLNSFIEIIEIIEKNNLIELFPESKNELQEIIINTFEKRKSIDPYNINLYLEYANWLKILNLKEKQETKLREAYQIAIEKRLNDKLINIAQNILNIDEQNINYICFYVDTLIYINKNEEAVEFLSQKLDELQRTDQIQEYQTLIQKYSNIIPMDKIKNIEREKLISKINNIKDIKEKLSYLKEYTSKYPDDYDIVHQYIIFSYNSKSYN
ncbi:MAG: tetratricopeptide repeat protein, partial [bacterium]